MPERLLGVSLNFRDKTFDFQDYFLQILRKDFPEFSVLDVRDEKSLEEVLPRLEGVVAWSFPEKSFARAQQLRFLLTPSAGKEHVAQDPSGTVRTVYGSFHGRMMAESLLGMILYFNRRFPDLLAGMRKRIWDRDIYQGARLLSGQKVLVIGFGKIGQACGSLLRLFGCEVTGIRRSSCPQGIQPGIDVLTPDRMMSVLEKADHVVLSLPGGSPTDRILTYEHLIRMKPSSFLYNIGRGNAVSESDLIRALREKRIAGCGLDVFEREPLPRGSPLWKFANVLVSPHAVCIYDEYKSDYLEEVRAFLGSYLGRTAPEESRP